MQDKGKVFHSIVTLVMTIGLSYFGYEKYEASQTPASSSASVEVHVDSKGKDHAHTAVVSQNDINQLIRNAVAASIKEQDRKNAATFKVKEIWD